MVLFSGMLPSSAGFMIEKWRSWPLFTHSCTRIQCVGEGEDRMWWNPSRKGKFEVSFFYRILASKDSIPFPWKSIWRTKTPLRVAFFGWMATLGKTLTLDNVRKRGIAMINRCCMSEADEESIDHLFLHCRVTRTLWNAIFSRFGLFWVMPSSVKELYATWWVGGKSQSAVLWKMVPLCLMWCI